MTTRRIRWVLLGIACAGCVSRIKEVDCAKQPLLCPELLQKAPRLHVEPPFGLSFDCVTLGCEQTRELQISNRGGGVISLTMVRLTLDTSTDFFVSLHERDPEGVWQELSGPRREDSITAAGVGPLDLLGERTIVVRVRYVPSDAQADVGGVLIEYDDGQWQRSEDRYERVELPLHARVMGVARASVATRTVSFGHVPVGEQKTDHVTLENVSRGTSILEVTEASVVGPGGDEGLAGEAPDSMFAIGVGWSPLANPGQVIEVPVIFAPEHEGAFWDEVVLGTNDPEQGEIRVELRGLSAEGAHLAVVEPAEAALDFGVVRVGQTRRRPLTLRNHGSQTIEIAVQVDAGPQSGFSMGEPDAGLAPLEPFDEMRLWVEYAASTAGPASGTLTIVSSEPTYAPVEIPLGAFCSAPELALSTSRIDLGTWVQGWTGQTKTFSVYNQGTGELTVLDVQLEVGSSNQVRMPALPPLPLMLSPDDPPLDVDIYLRANAVGPVEAAVLVHTDGVSEPVRRVALNGEVVTCEQGCPLANGTPDCSPGVCALRRCDDGWHDADQDLDNGCECREERNGADVGGTCSSGMDLGTMGDNCSGDPQTIDRTGNLHGAQDVDLYFVRSDDTTGFGCDVFGDSSETRVTLTEAPAGLVLCARIQDKGAGCGGYSDVVDPLYCGAVEYRHSGSYGDDDDRDMTAWVMWHPDASPVCASYALRFSGRK